MKVERTMDFWKRVLAVNPNVIARRIVGEDVLIPVQGRLADMQRIFALDPVAARIWKRLDGSADLETVVQSVLAAFDVPEERARRDLRTFVGRLEAAEIVPGGPHTTQSVTRARGRSGAPHPAANGDRAGEPRSRGRAGSTPRSRRAS